MSVITAQRALLFRSGSWAADRSVASFDYAHHFTPGARIRTLCTRFVRRLP